MKTQKITDLLLVKRKIRKYINDKIKKMNGLLRLGAHNTQAFKDYESSLTRLKKQLEQVEDTIFLLRKKIKKASNPSFSQGSLGLILALGASFLGYKYYKNYKEKKAFLEAAKQSTKIDMSYLS